MPERYAVFGHPVAHSWSPRIHAQFAAATGRDLAYAATDVAPGTFAEAVRSFFAAGGRGLNVTVPYKAEAFALSQQAAPAAARAGAANTLWQDERGKLCCDSTDGRGLVTDLQVNLGWHLAGRRVLLVGAGGAARSVLGDLLQEAPALVHVANRTAARAEQLVDGQTDAGALIASGLPALKQADAFDLIINSTSAGLDRRLPDLPGCVVTAETRFYDMVYGPAAAGFAQWFRAAGGNQLADGLGMLVEQAAESFCIWCGVRPDTASVIEALRRSL